LVHGIASRKTLTHSLFGTSSSIVDGFYDMMRAFIGIGVLPYVIAEMRWPENGKAVATRACRNITILYLCLCAVCYFGWGDDIKSNQKSPITTLYNLGGLYTLASRVMAVLLLVKTLASYPLFFWPMCREIETYLSWRDAPVMLRLPWAIRRWRRLKFGLRMGLVALTLIPFLMDKESIKTLVNFLVFVPIPLMNGVLPSFMAVSAIFLHWQLLRSSQTEADATRSGALGEAEARRSRADTGRSRTDTGWGRSMSVEYFCGTLSAHIAATLGVALVTCSYYLYKLYFVLVMTSSDLPVGVEGEAQE